MELVRRLVEISSPTEDIDACRKVIAEANAILTELLGTPGEVHDVLGRPTLRWGSATPRVLLLTHLDTVWPHGSFEPLWQVSGDVIRGPGVFDMKAGFVQAAYALQSLSDRNGVTILATTDEETGSECSKALIEEIASGAEAVLVFEASLDGKLKTARKGTSMYRVIVEGRAAHAGLARGVRRVPAYGLIRNFEPIDRVFSPLGVTVFGAGCLIGGEKDHFWMSYRQVVYADIRARHPESDFQKLFLL